MKNKKINKYLSIFGINNSINILLSDKIQIIDIFLLKNSLASKNIDIKNKNEPEYKYILRFSLSGFKKLILVIIFP